MSYTITDGFYSPKSAFAALEDLREVLDPITEHQIHHLVMSQVRMQMESGKVDDSLNRLTLAENTLHLVRHGEDSLAELLTGFRAAFFPHHLGGTLVYLFAENNAYLKALDESPEFSDYSYDSRSGAPEGVLEIEFSQRKVAWDCVLGRDGVLKRTLEYKSMDAFDVMRKFTELSFAGDRISPLWNRLLGAQDEPGERQKRITLNDLLDRPLAHAQA